MSIKPPEVKKYHFGTIVIDGTSYHRDVIIHPEGVYHPWWRKEGHNLAYEDLKPVIDMKIDLLIIGTGAFGRMKVSEEVKKRLEEWVSSIEILKTSKAVALYNEKKDKLKVVAALHLTC